MTTHDYTYTRKVTSTYTIKTRYGGVVYMLKLACGHDQSVPASAYHRKRRTCEECKRVDSQPFTAVDD